MDSRVEPVASSFFCAAPVVLFALVVGCAEELPTAPVDGLLTYRGKPVAGAQITFLHHEQTQPGVAVSGPDGKFHVSTWVAADGALIGRHRITVALGDSPARHAEHDDAAAPPADDPAATLPHKYASAGTTPLTCEIIEDRPNKVELDLVD